MHRDAARGASDSSPRGLGRGRVITALAVAVSLIFPWAFAEASSGSPAQREPRQPAPPPGEPAPPLPLPNFDIRSTAAAAEGGPASAQVEAARNLLAAELGAQGVIDIDQVTGTPRSVARLDGTLTGPSAVPAEQVALDYVRAHLDAFGLTEQDLSQMVLWKDYVDIDGTHHLVWQQRVDGIPAFDNGLRANVTADGRLLNVLGSPIHDLTPVTTQPALTAVDAVAAVRREAGALTVDPGRVESPSSGAQEQTIWASGDRAELVLLGVGGPGGATLGWQVNATDVSADASYIAVVDAATGATLWRTNTVQADTGEGNAWENHPGAPSGGTAQPVTFPVSNGTRLAGNNAHTYLDIHDEIEVPEDPVPAAAEVPATSALTWDYPTTFNTTDTSRNCSVSRPCTWNSKRANSWRPNIRQNAVQVYHYLNQWHDHLLAAPIGFTPAAGNFQVRNPPGQGRGRDAVQAQVGDGAATSRKLCSAAGATPPGGFPDEDHASNANMDTQQDGIPPKMQMYLWPGSGPRRCRIRLQSGDTNGGDDAGVAYHEYTHGLTNRLVTTNTGVPALDTFQSASMGEAWSDWYALDYLVSQGLETDPPGPGNLIFGPYGTGGRGIRSEATDCTVGAPASVCPGAGRAGPGGYTYGDITKIAVNPLTGKPAGPEVHADGEVWAQTLWDIRTALGSSVALRLVTRGLELSSPHPSFLDMRNAIVLADQARFNGSHNSQLWRIFARRGMGWFADTLTPNDFRPTEDFRVPPACPGPRCVTVRGRVTDSVTGRPVEGVRVKFGGHNRPRNPGFPVTLKDLTNRRGRYVLRNVPVGRYPRFLAGKLRGGYEPTTRTNVRVSAATTTFNLPITRDWASKRGGARVRRFTVPNYEEELGCGPRHAIDLKLDRGWLSDAVRPPEGGVAGPKSIVIRLPRAVNIRNFAVDPSTTCGMDRTTAVKRFVIETKRLGGRWRTAVVSRKALPQHQLSVLRPTGAWRRISLVRLTMLSNRLRPGTRGDGREFMALTELSVRGRPR